MKILFPFIFAALSVLPHRLSAAEQIITCPPELPLHDAAPIAGPPERLGTIMGKMQKRGKTEWTETYKLDVGYPEGVWFQCAYGESNSRTLAKKLDAAVKSCVVKGKAGSKLGQNIFDIRCS